VGVIGLGTNNYSVDAAPDLAARRAVLARFGDLDGVTSVIDTAPAYGRSEIVVGQLVAELGIRNRLFIATKVTAVGDDVAQARAMIDASFERLHTDRIDLLQVHSLQGVDVLMPVLEELKAARRIRYIGMTTSRNEQHAAMLDLMRRHGRALDFIQVNYSIEDRAAAERILPLAAEQGLGVLVNMPFGGRRGDNLFARVKDRSLPEWAAEAGAHSWSQLFLRYVVSHPAVTVAIPGTHRVEHAALNLAAAAQPLPDTAMRAHMTAQWDAL